jgi:hypothetical protein
MKKLKKLEIKKVTLRNLDEPALAEVAGGATGTCAGQISCPGTCPAHSCIITTCECKP